MFHIKNIKNFVKWNQYIFYLTFILFEHPGEAVLASTMPCWQDTILFLIRTVYFTAALPHKSIQKCTIFA